MARKKSKGKSAVFTVFNVNYEDGMVTSNRRVSSELLDQSFGESFQDLARIAIEDQDNEIAQRSGQRRAVIKSIVRA
jgi:predicted double-glycine peptidase